MPYDKPLETISKIEEISPDKEGSLGMSMQDLDPEASKSRSPDYQSHLSSDHQVEQGEESGSSPLYEPDIDIDKFLLKDKDLSSLKDSDNFD